MRATGDGEKFEDYRPIREKGNPPGEGAVYRITATAHLNRGTDNTSIMLPYVNIFGMMIVLLSAPACPCI